MAKESSYHDVQAGLGLTIAFLVHLSAFALVNAGFILIHCHDADEQIGVRVLFAWGIILMLHGAVVLTQSVRRRRKQRTIKINHQQK